MAYMAYQEAKVSERVEKWKRSHLINLLRELCKKTTIYGTYLNFESQACDLMTDEALRQTIINNWFKSQLEDANNILKAKYRSGDVEYKHEGRGRPYGAKNKPKDDGEAIDALEELKRDGLAEDVEDVKSYFEPTKARELPVIEAPKSNFDESKARELIALQMKDFIGAYTRDKDLLEKALKESLTIFETEVNKELTRKFDNLKPNLIEIKRNELPAIKLGVQHKNFEKLLRACSATDRKGFHNNLWVYGPAGTGKTTAAEMVAKALRLDFYSSGKMADEVKVTGYNNANGDYVGTEFRTAYENGGVFLADEIDGSMPDALLALNGALANGSMAFPDKKIYRHPDFIFIAAANTTGQGGTIEYVGRFQQDAAFNDRFVFLDWSLDEALEDSLVGNKDWLAYVRHVRNRCTSVSTIKGHLITPRASIYGETLLAAGMDLDTVKQMVLKKGLTEAQWNMIK